MQVNFLDQLDGLRKDFDTFCDENRGLAVKVQEKFLQAKEHLANASRVFQDINDNVISLVDVDLNGVDMERTASLMEEAPAGELRGETLKAIAEESSLALNMLYRGRVDVTSMYKFPQEQVAAARELGQQFRKFEKYWAQLRYRLVERMRPQLLLPRRGDIKPGSNDKKIIEPMLDAKVFCDQLVKHKIFKEAIPQLAIKLPFEKKLFEAAEDDSLWKDYERGWSGFTYQYFLYTGPSRILLNEPVSVEATKFIEGAWFEAFVQYLFEDQLRRLRKPYEVFTQLKYTTDLVGEGIFKGELDVLVSTEDKIVIVECKSGKLRKSESDRILQRKKVITEALKIAHAQDKQLDFILVHAPRDPESQEIIDELAANDVQAFDPPGVIGFIREHF